ncbi:MAG: hypothetical protein ACRDZU_08160 [Acidimicrobiales bacterium]
MTDIEPHDVAPEDIAPPAVAITSDAEAARRDERFAEGVRTLRVGGASLRLEERLLMVLGGIIAPLGIIVVLLGWWGASNTPYVFEQVPYLISGGVLGLSLVFLGAFFYFTHWVTQLVKEHRVQSVALLEAIQRLQDQVARQGDGITVGINGSDGDAIVLVATAQGSMAHRPGCTVVAGKRDLRQVAESDGLTPCKLCEPY